MLSVPAWHTHHIPGKIEMRRSGPHDWKANAPESLSQIKHPCGRSWIFSTSTVGDSFHLERRFPYRALGSSISPICGIPTNTVLLLPISKLQRPSHTPTNESRQKSDGCSLVTFFGIRKDIVVQACCGQLPLCSTFFRNSTISHLVSSEKSKGTWW